MFQHNTHLFLENHTNYWCQYCQYIIDRAVSILSIYNNNNRLIFFGGSLHRHERFPPFSALPILNLSYSIVWLSNSETTRSTNDSLVLRHSTETHSNDGSDWRRFIPPMLHTVDDSQWWLLVTQITHFGDDPYWKWFTVIKFLAG